MVNDTKAMLHLRCLALACVILTFMCLGIAQYLAADKAPPSPSAMPVRGLEQDSLQHPGAASAQRDAANAQLHRYGWNDATHQRLHIPVDVAMHVWLERQGMAP